MFEFIWYSVAVLTVLMAVVCGLTLAFSHTLKCKYNRKIKEVLSVNHKHPEEFRLWVSDFLYDIGYAVVDEPDAGIIIVDAIGQRYRLYAKLLIPEMPVNYDDMIASNLRGVDYALWVTSSWFTTKSQHYANKHNIMLLDGYKLARLMCRVKYEVE